MVTEGEVSDAVLEESSTPTNFTGGSHFLEQVEDAKDSVWLVRVIKQQWNFKPLSDATWSSVIKKVTKFGVRVGNFNCKTDYRYELNEFCLTTLFRYKIRNLQWMKCTRCIFVI